jgi:hypothetical protein
MELPKLVTYWCAKEALYKLHGTRQLSFKDHIAVEAFQDTDTYIQGSIFFNEFARQYHQLHRFWVEDFCGVMAV